jgi:hypothetical protein
LQVEQRIRNLKTAQETQASKSRGKPQHHD